MQAWEEELYRDTLVNSFFMQRFSGEALPNLKKGFEEGMIKSTPNDVMNIKTDLGARGRTRTRKGDKLTFGLIPRIDPKVEQGVTSGQTLKGKEVATTDNDFSIELERYRQAVSGGNYMDWQRAAYNIPMETRAALLAWGRDKLELLAFDALRASPTSIFYFDDASSAFAKTATLATAKAAVETLSGKLTPTMVSFVKAWAKTGGARASNQIPLRPVMVDGKPYYVLLTHPDAAYDWKNDSTVMQAMREAEVRGRDNPIFQGASWIWDGTIIHEHEYVTITTDGGAGGAVPLSEGHLMGAQALAMGWGERPSMVEDTEDYEEDLFFAWRMTTKIQKPVFNSVDYGSVMVLSARTQVSGV
jgi:N4-gp56 family major capsid protein